MESNRERDLRYAAYITREGNKKRSRENRYLISFARDFKNFLSNGDYYKKHLEEAKEKSNTYWDFIVSFDSLKEKMAEFKWSKDFLKENGIDFAAIRSLYFAVA